MSICANYLSTIIYYFILFMKAIVRLYQYFEYKGIKPTRLEKEIGLSNGYFSVQLKRHADLGSGIIENVINNCRDINIEWLLTGNGPMLSEKVVKTETLMKGDILPQNQMCDNCKTKDELIDSLKDQVQTLKKLVRNLEKDKKPE
jgi:hypothetical protein